jgi:hypothetical protein
MALRHVDSLCFVRSRGIVVLESAIVWLFVIDLLRLFIGW